jgi:hypothetical protein
VNFAFDDDQLEFRSQFRAFLDRECAASDVRAAFELAADSRAPDRERWMKLASIGVLGITVPESFGGLGLGMVDLVGLLEDAGRAGLPEPLAETSGIVVPLLAEIARSSSGGRSGARVSVAVDRRGRSGRHRRRRKGRRNEVGWSRRRTGPLPRLDPTARDRRRSRSLAAWFDRYFRTRGRRALDRGASSGSGCYCGCSIRGSGSDDFDGLRSCAGPSAVRTPDRLVPSRQASAGDCLRASRDGPARCLRGGLVDRSGRRRVRPSGVWPRGVRPSGVSLSGVRPRGVRSSGVRLSRT